jgi:hypothetical protein
MKTCDRVQQRLPEYWAGTMAVKDHRDIDQHLETCAECKAEADQLGRLWNNLDLLPVEAPRQQVRTRFYEMLDAYRSGIEESTAAAAASNKRNWFSWVLPWQLAGAMAMLAVGFFAGRQFMGPQEGGATKKTEDNPQIAQLRGEVNSMRQMMALSLLQQQSATDRMRGVNYAYRVDKSNSEVIAALLETVKTDPSVNVRLAAVDAFKNFASNSSARRGLLESVAQQDSPLVQIAIIELLVDLNDQTAVKGLNTLADNPKLQREVKERARWAVSQLH